MARDGLISYSAQKVRRSIRARTPPLRNSRISPANRVIKIKKQAYAAEELQSNILAQVVDWSTFVCL
jgi:hypothetical protein